MPLLHHLCFVFFMETCDIQYQVISLEFYRNRAPDAISITQAVYSVVIVQLQEGR